MAVEWQETTLEEVADEITVGYVGPMASEYVSSGIPFLRSQNVEPLRINDDDLKFIAPAFHQKIQKSKLAPGDVVIVRTGKPGSCAVIPDWLEEANCSDLVIVRCGKRIDNRFLAYYVNTVATHHVAAHLVGAVQQHFNVGSARTMRLSLPPLAEQKAIASVLGALDDKIELNRRMNATLESMAQALFQSWFVDFDPVKANAEGRKPAGLDAETAALFPSTFQDSSEGPIPSGWKVTQLNDLGQFKNGANFSQKDYGPGLRIVNVKQLYGTRYVTTSSLLEVDANAIPNSESLLLRQGDLLFARSSVKASGAGQVAMVGSCPNGTIFSGFIIRFRITANQKVLPEFLNETLRSPAYRELLVRVGSGTTITNLNQATLGQLKIVLPPFAIITAFEKVLDLFRYKILQNEEQSRTLASLRDTLLPKLLSGELRLYPLAEGLL